MTEIKQRSISQLQLSGAGPSRQQNNLLLTDRGIKRNNTTLDSSLLDGSKSARNYTAALKSRAQFAGNVTEAHRQLTNTSKSKNVHDFGKGEDRFKLYDRQARTINQQIGYDLPSTLIVEFKIFEELLATFWNSLVPQACASIGLHIGLHRRSYKGVHRRYLLCEKRMCFAE